MDTFINRWKSSLLRDRDIDVIDDLAESVWLPDYLQEKDTLMSVYTAFCREPQMERIILWRSRDMDTAFENTVTLQAIACAPELYEYLQNAEGLNFAANTMYLGEINTYISLMALKLYSGFIFTFTAGRGEETFVQGKLSQYATMLTICKTLAPRDRIAKKYTKVLKTVNMEYIDQQFRDDVAEQSEELFKSNRESVLAWRNAFYD